MIITYQIIRKSNITPTMVCIDLNITEEDILNSAQPAIDAINKMYDDIVMIIYHPAFNPTIKTECVRCGFCCLRLQCSVSIKKYGKQKVCPALKWNENKYECILYELEEMKQEWGTGCNANVNQWRNNIKKRT